MPGLPIIDRIRSEERPLRWVTSRILWATGLCSAFSVRLRQGPKICFCPSSISAGLWVNPEINSEELDFIAKELRAGDTFIDIGANIGQFTLVGAQRVGPSGSVVAIEPHPRTFCYLRKNIERNGFSNVRLINAAAGSNNGNVFISDTRSDDMNHIDLASGIRVSLVTLDSLKIPGTVSLLKMDVEGFEPDVLRGAALLLRQIRCILFECSEWNLNRYGHSSGELRALLQSAGFKIFQLRSGGLAPMEQASNGADGNLVALKRQ